MDDQPNSKKAMTISQVITWLSAVRDQHGDIDCWTGSVEGFQPVTARTFAVYPENMADFFPFPKTSDASTRGRLVIWG